MADNPFSVSVVNPMQALMLGQQSYKTGQEQNEKQALTDARARAVQAYQGGDSKGAIATLLGVGDTQGANAIGSIIQNDWTRQHSAQTDARAAANDAFSQNLQTQQLGISQRSADRADNPTPSGFQRIGGGLQPIAGGPADPSYKRTVTDKQNAPSGYKWADPNDPDAGLLAIPGGPGEKVPAEVAARLGLAKSFLGQLEDYKDVEGNDQKGLRSRIKAGEATGPIDSLMGAAGVGQPASIRRKLASGAEALLRNLTGAGMNIDEAKKYIARYEPELRDNSESLLDKVNQLERELRSVNDVVSQGRGGSVLDRPSVSAKPQINGGNPVKVSSPQQAMKLPPGTKIVLPDGSIGTVPAR